MHELLVIQYIIPFLPAAPPLSIFRQISFHFMVLAAAVVSQPRLAFMSAFGDTISWYQFLSLCL